MRALYKYTELNGNEFIFVLAYATTEDLNNFKSCIEIPITLNDSPILPTKFHQFNDSFSNLQLAEMIDLKQ